MIIVPVREQDSCEVIWRNAHHPQTVQKILGVRIHADIDGNRTALHGHEIGACKIRRSVKTPHPFGDWYDLDVYGVSPQAGASRQFTTPMRATKSLKASIQD
jgi:hypothetical protein